MKRGKNFSPFHSFKYFDTHFLCAQLSPCSLGILLGEDDFSHFRFLWRQFFLLINSSLCIKHTDDGETTKALGLCVHMMAVARWISICGMFSMNVLKLWWMTVWHDHSYFFVLISGGDNQPQEFFFFPFYELFFFNFHTWNS